MRYLNTMEFPLVAGGADAVGTAVQSPILQGTVTVDTGLSCVIVSKDLYYNGGSPYSGYPLVSLPPAPIAPQPLQPEPGLGYVGIPAPIIGGPIYTAINAFYSIMSFF
jgi:hypothetical protein